MSRSKIQRIALVAVDHLDREALCHVLNACERLDARTDLLTGLPAQIANLQVAEAHGGGDTPWRLLALEKQRRKGRRALPRQRVHPAVPGHWGERPLRKKN